MRQHTWAGCIDCIKCGINYVVFGQWKICKWNRMWQSGIEIMPAARPTLEFCVLCCIKWYFLRDRAQLRLFPWLCPSARLYLRYVTSACGGALFGMQSHSICVNVWTLGRLSIGAICAFFRLLVAGDVDSVRSADNFIPLFVASFLIPDAKHHFSSRQRMQITNALESSIFATIPSSWESLLSTLLFVFGSLLTLNGRIIYSYSYRMRITSTSKKCIK